MIKLEELQPRVFNDIKKVISDNKVSHAYLFSGNFGSFEIALYLAKSRFCESLKDGLPCLSCRPCSLIDAHEFTDVKIIEPSGQLIKTETIRDLLKEFTSSGYEGKSQVFIIKEAHKMHPNAANALLKFIEEPQSESYMILLTDDVDHILPTIRSRTQVIHFPKNRKLLFDKALEAGLLRTQAEILADLSHTPSQLEVNLSHKRLFDLIDVCQLFMKKFYDNSPIVYLEVAKLTHFISDKKEQELAFSLLVLLCTKELANPLTPNILKGLYYAQDMWKRNVTFQNALEYMVIKFNSK